MYRRRMQSLPVLVMLTLLMLLALLAVPAQGQGPAIHLLLNGAQAFDGTNALDYGTSSNGLFTDSFSLHMDLSYTPPAGAVEIFTNHSFAGSGIRIADEPASGGQRLLVAQLHLPLSLIASLAWSYPDTESPDVDLVFIVERSGTGPVYDWNSRLLVDGLTVGTSFSSWPAIASTDNLYLGRNVAGTVFWEGTAADLYVFTGLTSN